MTFQVVLVGTDGVIVGSDRRISIRSGQSEWQFGIGSKFTVRQDESVICAAAGGPQSQDIARTIVNHCDPTQDFTVWCESLRTVAESVPGNSQNDEVLVIRTGVPDIALVHRHNQIASISRIGDRLCTGVTATARFLTQHFWEPASVESIKNLALLVLEYAAKERGTEVGDGFDIMVLKDGVVTWEQYSPSDERIRKIHERFKSGVHALLVAGE